MPARMIGCMNGCRALLAASATLLLVWSPWEEKQKGCNCQEDEGA